jgi:hypothetical protein
MKVKIFKSWDMNSQEKEIISWMEENSNIVIQNILQSSAGPSSGGSVYCQITIFYSELAFEKIK